LSSILAENKTILPLISVIVLNYNAQDYLINCLRSLEATAYPNLEILLVDNASTDKSAEILKKLPSEYNKTRLIFLPRNYGFSMGNNIGARYAHGKYLVFLNPDTEVSPDWLNFIDDFENDNSIGAAQPKLLKHDGKIDSAGGFMTFYGLGWCKNADQMDSFKNKSNVTSEIFFAKGAALIIRRSVFDRIGGFDPLLFIYYEEVDLCWRVWMSGYRVVFFPKSVVYHVGAVVLNKHQNFTKYNEAKGRMVVVIKNNSTKNLVWAMPLCFFLFVPNVIRHFVRGDSKGIMAIVKGSVWWLFNFKKIWQARLNQQIIGLHFLDSLPVEEKLPFGYLTLY
jgi:GT2 family glycosyltransferase